MVFEEGLLAEEDEKAYVRKVLNVPCSIEDQVEKHMDYMLYALVEWLTDSGVVEKQVGVKGFRKDGGLTEIDLDVEDVVEDELYYLIPELKSEFMMRFWRLEDVRVSRESGVWVFLFEERIREDNVIYM